MYAYLRNRLDITVIFWVIYHYLVISYKVDKIMSAQREWFIILQLTDKLWYTTRQIVYYSWSTVSKREKKILQILQSLRHYQNESRPVFLT